jgi:hypothetical protein
LGLQLVIRSDSSVDAKVLALIVEGMKLKAVVQTDLMAKNQREELLGLVR